MLPHKMFLSHPRGFFVPSSNDIYDYFDAQMTHEIHVAEPLPLPHAVPRENPTCKLDSLCSAHSSKGIFQFQSSLKVHLSLLLLHPFKYFHNILKPFLNLLSLSLSFPNSLHRLEFSPLGTVDFGLFHDYWYLSNIDLAK
ncbi:hypothetical protein RJT34_31991 [Clitoria ternatea]|uniref:Uncharacterized protein n=1 Tax=Clitoria ternatea TaxID=43366 RepID=A0AAN9I3B7_CLITE